MRKAALYNAAQQTEGCVCSFVQPARLIRCVELLVSLSNEEVEELGLQDHVCRLSLHMKCLAALKVFECFAPSPSRSLLYWIPSESITLNDVS